MWQALLEEGTISHGKFHYLSKTFKKKCVKIYIFFSVFREHYFKDKYLFYRFTLNDDKFNAMRKNSIEKKTLEEQLQESIMLLTKIGPDATLRMILRKPYFFLLFNSNII